MRVVPLVLALLLALGSPMDAKGGRSKEDQEERKACDTPFEPADDEEVQPPQKVHWTPLLGGKELERWGPIEVSAVITCKGRVKSIEVSSPKLRRVANMVARNLRSWRFEPARLGGRPVAVKYTLKISSP